MLDHVERKVVRPAKTPDADEQQDGVDQRRVLDQEQARREQTQEQKQCPFDLDLASVSQIAQEAARLIVKRLHAIRVRQVDGMPHIRYAARGGAAGWSSGPRREAAGDA